MAGGSPALSMESIAPSRAWITAGGDALRNAEFEPDTERVWRWVADGTSVKTVVKFELLADLDTEANEATVRFDACDNLGAVNLRGTGFASRDPVVQQLTAKIGGDLRTVEVTGAGRHS